MCVDTQPAPRLGLETEFWRGSQGHAPQPHQTAGCGVPHVEPQTLVLAT